VAHAVPAASDGSTGDPHVAGRVGVLHGVADGRHPRPTATSAREAGGVLQV
jgi:hypothetical protein